MPWLVGRGRAVPPVLAMGIAAAVLMGIALSLDTVVRDAVKPWRTPMVLTIAAWATRLGYGWVLGAAGAILAAAGSWFGWRRLVRAGLVNIPALIVSGLATRVLKIGIGRPRPRLIEHGVAEWGPSFVSGFNSFPSGHATSAFTFAAVFAAYAPSWRIAVYMLAAIISLSRVFLDAHFFSDIVAGALVGVLVGRVAVAMAGRRWPERPAQHASGGE